MIKKIVKFFDKFEDRIRGVLSRKPILYAFVGAVGIILVWKGIWEIANLFPILHGPGALILGSLILLASGLLVSFFVGDSILLSGLKREKKLIEKTESEVKSEKEAIFEVSTTLKEIQKDLKELKKEK